MLASVLANATVFHQAHPEDVSSFVNTHIGRHQLEILGREHGRSCLSYTDFAGMGLSLVTYGDEVRVKSPVREGIYHFQVITRGQCYWHRGDDRQVLARGQAVMINPSEHLDLVYSANCEKLIVRVPETDLQQVVRATCPRATVKEVAFLRQPLELAHLPGLVKLLEAVFAEVEENEADLSALSGPYRDIMLRKLIQVFPNSAMASVSHQPSSPVLERMLTHIEQNLKRGVDMEELSSLSNLSVRSIYNLFARHFSTTPKCYIKQLRLQGLREDLLRGNARNVTEAALEYGFMHLGRFSSEYRKAFGELPSDTIKSTCQAS